MAVISFMAKVFFIFFFSTFTEVDFIVCFLFNFPGTFSASKESSSPATSSGYDSAVVVFEDLVFNATTSINCYKITPP